MEARPIKITNQQFGNALIYYLWSQMEDFPSLRIIGSSAEIPQEIAFFYSHKVTEPKIKQPKFNFDFTEETVILFSRQEIYEALTVYMDYVDWKAFEGHHLKSISLSLGNNIAFKVGSIPGSSLPGEYPHIFEKINVLF